MTGEIRENTGENLGFFLKAVVESMDSFFIMVDKNLRVLTFNKSMAERLKKLYGRQIQAGDFYLDFVSEYTREHEEKKIRLVLGGSVLHDEQQFNIPKQNSDRWFSITHYPVFDTRGNILGATVHYRDIDQIKSVEQKAMENEHLLNSVLDSMFNSFAFFNKDLTLIRCSPRFKKQVELFMNKKFEYYQPIEFYLPEQDKEKVIERARMALQGKKIDIECTFYHEKLGRDVWVNQVYQPVFSYDKKLIGVAFHGINIDDQKRAELELQRSYDRLTTVLRASHDAVWELDLSTGVVTRNENFALLFGYEPEEQNQRLDWWQKHVHPEDKESVLDIFEGALKNKLPQISFEYRFKCLNGSYKYVRDSFCILYNENSEPYRLIGSIQDIDKLEGQKHMLQKQNTLLKDFAYVQSHMIRKPIANIAGLYELVNTHLINHTDLDTDLKAYLEQMHQSIMELDNMVKQSIDKINGMEESQPPANN
jgi:PAS domain S-box-containing protein